MVSSPPHTSPPHSFPKANPIAFPPFSLHSRHYHIPCAVSLSFSSASSKHLLFPIPRSSKPHLLAFIFIVTFSSFPSPLSPGHYDSIASTSLSDATRSLKVTNRTSIDRSILHPTPHQNHTALDHSAAQPPRKVTKVTPLWETLGCS